MSRAVDDRERFLLDLEFVNALASPQYLQREPLHHGNALMCSIVRSYASIASDFVSTKFHLARQSMMQCLAMPMMRRPNHADLAQSRYFDDASFIGYLKYLQYWHEPQYAKYVMCVACLIKVPHGGVNALPDKCTS